MSLPRLGILSCDTIWEPLRSRHGDYPDMYAALLREAGAAFEARAYALHEGDFPALPTDCDAWLISGSRATVFEDVPWIADALTLVREIHQAGRPQVGICFGHQLLAQALGGQVARAPGGWGYGNIKTRVEKTPDGGVPEGQALRLFMAHQDQVMHLPPGAEALASAAHCPNAMFVLPGRSLGIQAHPEFSFAFMQEMTLEESTFLTPAQRERALTDLAEPVDSALVGRWMAAFLRLI